MTYLYISAWAVSGVIGALIATARKQNALAGAFLGILLGPIGWLILAISGPNSSRRRQCPHCQEWVPLRATACSHCGRDLPTFVRTVDGPAPRSEAVAIVVAWVTVAIGVLSLVGSLVYVALA